MELNLKEYAVERVIGGRTLRISTGLLAKQAAGSAVVQYADAVVLSAATTAPPRFPDQDFFPLMVDYRERTYAAGKFPGGFFKREKAPSTKEILTMRLADRPIRPLFPKGFFDEVLVQSIVLSADMVNDPDILSIVGASAALSLSPLPFEGPIGAVRIGLVDDEFIVNPTNQQEKVSKLKLVLAGTADSITMVEAGASDISEEKMIEALELGHCVVKEIVAMIRELVEKAGRTEKIQIEPPALPSCLDEVRAAIGGRMAEALKTEGKFGRREAASKISEEIVEQFTVEEGEKGPSAAEVREAVAMVKTEVIRDLIRANSRVDGRDNFTVRPIDCRVSVLPRTHGSSLFTRGETQAIVSVTLGSSSDAQEVDGLRDPYEEMWYIHYNAPGFSVGEAKMPRGPGRREIGHGMLAQRALESVMPHDTGFPYAVRAVSEVLEMNGSSSMATVCGATLALMDAGVPIKKPVAGIAMGLIQDEGREPTIITDILGDEDHYGDMDFKVCGTRDGITALQMDIKVKGISTATMRKALAQARDGRLHILGEIEKCLKEPRPEINPRAPRLHNIQVPQDMVGKIIGPGGKTIRGIQEECGVQVEVDDSTGVGIVSICAPDAESLACAVRKVEGLIEVPEVGRVYEGGVTDVRDFGVFVEILPGTEGMCHISELDDKRVESTESFCKKGDILKVKVIEIDPSGKVRLSRKAVLMEERGETYTVQPRKPSGDRGRGGRDRAPRR
ncbi:MAG: polyribonucleotide nucleotidyltransferase [Planctomycetota bacterium]|jgi:polyribonucleotide nucleotidyltransferase|nr:polyribonucleotide nucleotidyltransferase [Planctomycetota bacterium]